jgi:hypothetical protein
MCCLKQQFSKSGTTIFSKQNSLAWIKLVVLILIFDCLNKQNTYYKCTYNFTINMDQNTERRSSNHCSHIFQ